MAKIGKQESEDLFDEDQPTAAQPVLAEVNMGGLSEHQVKQLIKRTHNQFAGQAAEYKSRLSKFDDNEYLCV